MSAQTADDFGLAAFADVPEPVDDEETDAEPDPAADDDDTEAAGLADFDDATPTTVSAEERLRREYIRSGHRLERTADALDQNPSAVLSELADAGDVRVERLSDEWLAHLFDDCDRDTDAVADAARESRLAVSVRLVKSGVADPDEIPADCLRQVHDDYHGEYYKLRDELEVSARDVLWALVDIGLVEPHVDFFVARLWPEDLGLSPLHCEECREEIGSYPCECGHDPGNGYDDRGEDGDGDE